jgi:hypothetical protein
MSKELVNRWFNKISISERNLPLLLVDGYAYTPQMAYDEVNRGTQLGARLQSLIEMGKFGTSSLEEQAIAKVRIQTILASKPQDKPLFATMSNKVFTPAQLMEEINSGTLIGQQWVTSEISRMRNIVQVR